MKRLRCLILTLCLMATFASCRQQYPLPLPPISQFFGMCDFETGNLIFIYDTTGMGSAIHSSTAWDSLEPTFTHVAITECTDSGVYVIDATPSLGVAMPITVSSAWRHTIILMLTTRQPSLSVYNHSSGNPTTPISCPTMEGSTAANWCKNVSSTKRDTASFHPSP